MRGFAVMICKHNALDDIHTYGVLIYQTSLRFGLDTKKSRRNPRFFVKQVNCLLSAEELLHSFLFADLFEGDKQQGRAEQKHDGVFLTKTPMWKT